MSSSLYNAFRNDEPLPARVIYEGRQIAVKTAKETMVHIRRMDENIRGRVEVNALTAGKKTSK